MAWRQSSSLILGRFLVRISTGTPIILTNIFFSFLYSPTTDYFQCIIHNSLSHSTLYSATTDIVTIYRALHNVSVYVCVQRYLTLQNSVVTPFTVFFKVLKFCILSTECICLSRMVPTINNMCYLNNIKLCSFSEKIKSFCRRWNIYAKRYTNMGAESFGPVPNILQHI